jgi:hypothetical protein
MVVLGVSWGFARVQRAFSISDRRGPAAVISASARRRTAMIKIETPLDRRAEAAKKYRPGRIRLMLVAEAPPVDEARYFYYEDVQEHDSLFRYVVRGILGVEPTRANKSKLLEVLKQAGVCLRGPMDNKAIAIRNVANVLEPDGVLFGVTVLGTAERHTPQARAVLRAFNWHGDFDNLGDTAEGLRRILEESFRTVKVDVVGSIANFTATAPR